MFRAESPVYATPSFMLNHQDRLRFLSVLWLILFICLRAAVAAEVPIPTPPAEHPRLFLRAKDVAQLPARLASPALARAIARVEAMASNSPQYRVEWQALQYLAKPDAAQGRNIVTETLALLQACALPDPAESARQHTYPPQPAVDRYKFIEPRRLTLACDRWAHNRTDILQYALLNGDGYQKSWENVWGIWNGITPRDAEALRRISAIYHALPDLLSSADYEPLAPTLQPGVYATEFPGESATLWTLVNRRTNTLTGAQIKVVHEPRMRFFDLWRGAELKPEISGDTATLSFAMESGGYGAVAAMMSPDKPLLSLLTAMKRWANIRPDNLSAEWKVLPQQMVEIAPIRPAAAAPEGMILIPAGGYKFETQGGMIEKSEGMDVQFPWEDKPSLKHQHEFQMKAFYMDRTPVTCAEFERFLDATHCRPKDDHNFLRDWNRNNFPEGWAKKPVTWVSLEDDANRVPPFVQVRKLRPPTDVDAFPNGASPFGVLDLIGNVWQWTDEFQDKHTRAAILKGGSYYHPATSKWYFPQARELSQHGKYLLLAPSIDRSATIGFHCVKDASQS
jgi:gamma-glutamyl hercynylcysteine S-oxide synthase